MSGDTHDRWIFARRPPCPKCKNGKLIYSGSSPTGRCRYAACDTCGYRTQLIALGRVVVDDSGVPRLRTS